MVKVIKYISYAWQLIMHGHIHDWEYMAECYSDLCGCEKILKKYKKVTGND